MTTTVAESLVLYLALLLGALFTVVAAVRARTINLRDLPAYDTLPGMLGETVEAGKAVHVSFGGSAVREESTLSALASAELLYQVAERVVIGDQSTLVTLSDPLTLTLAQDTLRRAYKVRGRAANYRPIRAQWYPQGPSSLAFAAAAGIAIVDEPISANVLLGRFGPELMLIAENAQRTNQRIVAQSDQIEGQAVAYAISQTPLIGEELYVGGAYLTRTPVLLGGVAALDALRAIVVVLIFLAALIAFLHGS